MTSLVGELVSKTEVTSSPDYFFDILAHRPYVLVNGAPDIFKGFDLLDGLWGILGCIVSATLNDGGTTIVIKATIVAIDEVNKSVSYLVLGGDLLDSYSAFTFIFKTGTDGDGKKIVTTTLEYLKLLPITPDPTSMMNLAIAVIKEIDGKNLVN